jgi:ubiquinone/menaquinone biosynthesis C-methylase UbiE
LTEPTFWSRFRHVDAGGDHESLTAYLDGYNALEPVVAGKARSVELLGVGEGDSVLDVGCGAGDETRALLAVVGERGRAVGIDASERLIAEARRRAAAAGVEPEFTVADATALPFADGEFDGCRCDRTLQHLEKPSTALAEMLRVVRPGGRIVVTETGNALEGEPTVDAGLLATAREHFAPIGAKDGWFGTFVPVLLTRAGLEDVGVDEQRGDVADFESVSRCFNLVGALRAMVEAGDCSQAAAAELVSGLREDVEQGRGRAVVRSFSFYGTVPAAPAVSEP